MINEIVFNPLLLIKITERFIDDLSIFENHIQQIFVKPEKFCKNCSELQSSFKRFRDTCNSLMINTFSVVINLEESQKLLNDSMNLKKKPKTENHTQTDFKVPSESLDKLHQNLEEKENTVQFLLQKVKAQEEKCKLLTKQIIDSESKNSELQSSEYSLNNEVSYLKSKIKSQESLYHKKVESKLDVKENQIQDLIKQLQLATKKFTDLKQDMQEKLDRQENELSEEKEKTFELQDKILALKKEKLDLTGKIYELNQNIFEKDNSLIGLEESHSKYLEIMKTKYLGRISELYKDLNDWKFKYNELELMQTPNRVSLVDINDSLFNELSEIQDPETVPVSFTKPDNTKIHHLNAQIEELTAKLQKAGTEIEELQRQNNEQSKKLKDQELISNLLKAELKDLKKSNKDLKSELELFKHKTCDNKDTDILACLRAETSLYKQKSESLEALILQTEQHWRDMYNKSQDQLTSYEKDLNDSKRKLVYSEHQIEFLNSKIEESQKKWSLSDMFRKERKSSVK